MSAFFTVDEKSCRRDGICVAECPARILVTDPESKLPKAVKGAENICIGCGHCVAVCPTAAVRLGAQDFSGFVPVRKELDISPEQAVQFLTSRRSIRAFAARNVPRAELEAALDAARFAPTAGHGQPVRWVLVHDPADCKALAQHVVDWMIDLSAVRPALAEAFSAAPIIKAWERGSDLVLRGAPHLAVAVTDNSAGFGSQDASIALTYLELSAHALGIGACWAGYLTAAAKHWQPLRAALGLTETETAHGGQMLGYAKYAYPRLPWRKPLNITWK